MASSDYPMGSMSPAEESMYPDPDVNEYLRYSWQGEQQVVSEEVSASVIDPRLFPQNDKHAAGQVQPYDELSNDEDQPAYLQPNDILSDDDSDFEYVEESQTYVSKPNERRCPWPLMNNLATRMDRMNTQKKMTLTTRPPHGDVVAAAEGASQAGMELEVVKASREVHESQWNRVRSSRCFIRKPPPLSSMVIMNAPSTP